MTRSGASGGRSVRPVDLTGSSSVPSGAEAARIRAILANAPRHTLTGWWTDRGYDRQPVGPLLDLGGIDEDDIRSPASQAYALAVSMTLGAFGADAVGRPVERARDVALRLVRSVAGHHRAA